MANGSESITISVSFVPSKSSAGGSHSGFGLHMVVLHNRTLRTPTERS